ncbi:MAG: S-layer homology domain-containing protein [Clostridiales bacterium]|nr:S-layer homology domain-containing protein [Clostridiales bacterium]
MKNFARKIVLFGLIAMLAAMPMTAYASGFGANFRDVGANHWAADAIALIGDLGIMSGDLSGNFNPNGNIDKFEAVRIFARMSGFNPATQTPAQRTYYDAVFEQRRALIEGFSGNFLLWNANFNREIAFLLYTGVLVPADLSNFIIVQNNIESRRILTREETAVFLVRFMERVNQALSTFGVPLFNDDHLISPAARPHVYYLRYLGIMIGSEGNVSPRQPVTRAAMALLVESTLREVDSPLLGGQSGSNTPPAVESISGTIANTFPSFRSILATTATENRIFPISQTAIITIGGINSTFADLAADMTFTAILSGGEIVSINALSPNVQPPVTPVPPIGEIIPLPPIADMRVLDGTIARLNAQNRTIGIETRTINPRGEIVSEIRDYYVPITTPITRSGTMDVNFNAINVGDLVIARVHGDTAFLLNLEERVRQISGTLVEKNFGTNSLFPSLVIADADGNNHSFTVDSSAQISRGNQRNLNSRQLRIGDYLELSAEYGRATQIQARAVAQVTRDAYIRDIFISTRGQSFIVVSDNLYASTPDRMHLLVDGQVDPFELTLGSRVRLWFDSQEVIGITTLHGPSATNFTGHIQNITSNQIVLRDANFQTRTFVFDSNTVFVNSITGQIINVHHLGIGMRVQIISAAAQNNRAVSVTVLVN